MRDFKPYEILTAQDATGTGKIINVADFKNVIFSFATDGGSNAALTVKFQGSISETAPDFAAAQSNTNMWDYIEVIDLEDGAPIDGDTGVSVAGADDYRLFEANINGMTWICATVTARTAGSVNISAKCFSEE